MVVSLWNCDSYHFVNSILLLHLIPYQQHVCHYQDTYPHSLTCIMRQHFKINLAYIGYTLPHCKLFLIPVNNIH